MLYFIARCPRGRPLGHAPSDCWGVTILDIWRDCHSDQNGATIEPPSQETANQWQPSLATLATGAFFDFARFTVAWVVAIGKWRNKEWVLGAFLIAKIKNARKRRLAPPWPIPSPLAHVLRMCRQRWGAFYANTTHPYTILHPQRPQWFKK
jgi:hypothetical protein